MTNKVQGMPERQFAALWVATLWGAMTKTGKGYRRFSLRFTGKRNEDGSWDRRADKIGTTKLQRQIAQGLQTA